MAKAATVELKVLAEATDAIKDVGKVEASLSDLEKAAKEVGQGASGIDELAASMDGLKDKAEAASKTGGGLSEAFAAGLAGGGVVAAVGGLQDIVSEGFSRLGELAVDTFSKALDFNTGRIKLQAQLGLSAEDAKRFGQLAGDLYSSAYGDSIDQVNEALSLVTRTLHLNIGTQQADLQQITGDILNLANVFGIDLEKAVIGVGQLVKTGLASNAQEATDILTRGLQVAGQDADDLLDTLVEYPTNFRRLGLSGKEALGLINQGLKAGARNSDQVADSLAEFTKKVVDGSTGTAAALKDIGLQSAQIPEKIAAGGDKAKEAFNQVVEAMKRVENPAQRLQDITALFGTPAEDMAAAWDALDLSHAVDELGNVEGAAKRLGETVGSDPTQKWEAFKRSIETNVVRFLADNVIPAFDSLAPALQTALTKLGQIWDAFVLGFRGDAGVTDVLGGSITAIENMKEPPTPMGGTMQDIKDFGQEIRDLADVWIPRLQTALTTLQDTLKTTAQFFKDNQTAMEVLKDVGITLLIGALLVLVGILTLVIGSIAATVIAIGTMLLPIGLVVTAARGLGITWGDVWNGIKFAVSNAAEIVRDIIGGIAQAILGLADTMVAIVDGDWQRAWNKFKEIVAGVFQALTAPITGFLRLIEKILDKVEQLTHIDIPFVGNNSVQGNAVPRGPGVAAFGVAPMSSFASSSTTINLSVQHTGLGVDSPALQRDIVRALQRLQAREGPIRVRTAS